MDVPLYFQASTSECYIRVNITATVAAVTFLFIRCSGSFFGNLKTNSVVVLRLS